MHAPNPFHVFISNMLFHSRLVAGLLFSTVLTESLLPGCSWVAQDLLEHFLNTFYESFK